jgi:hypothetical protein
LQNLAAARVDAGDERVASGRERDIAGALARGDDAAGPDLDAEDGEAVAVRRVRGDGGRNERDRDGVEAHSLHLALDYDDGGGEVPCGRI